MSWHKYKILAHGKQIEQIRKWLFSNEGELPPPFMGVLQLNYSCNENCRGCAFPDWNKANFIPKEKDAFRMVDESMDYGVKAWDICGGGEPTLIPYLLKLLQHIIDRNCNYAIITNGVYMPDDLLAYIARTATYIRVSLETGDRDLYAYYKRIPPEYYDRVIENIRMLRDLKHPDTELSLKFDIDKTLNGDNHIRTSFKTAIGLGVDTVTFKSMTGESEPSDWNKIESEYLLNSLIKGYSGKTTIINSIYFNKSYIPQCWLNPLHTVIDGYGDVYICCYYYNPKGHPKSNHCLGNLFDKSFKEIWESPEHKEKIKNIKKEHCALFDCKFFNHHKVVNEAIMRGRLEII